MNNPYQKGGLLYIAEGIDPEVVKSIVDTNKDVIELLKSVCCVPVYKVGSGCTIRFDNGRSGVRMKYVDVSLRDLILTTKKEEL